MDTDLEENKTVIKVNGSFYCVNSEATNLSRVRFHDNRTILTIGHDTEHTIKLNIGSSPEIEPDDCGMDDFFEKRRTLASGIRDSCEHQESSQTADNLNTKLLTLRREIASLVKQDDALFRQLMTLSQSIEKLRSAAGLCTHVESSKSSSLTSLTSLSEGNESDDDDTAQALLSRNWVSYPPKSRNRSSLASSSGFSSTGSTSSSLTPSSEEDYKSIRNSSTPSTTCTCNCNYSGNSNHKRQGSCDSGIQGSEPSDGEVFV